MVPSSPPALFDSTSKINTEQGVRDGTVFGGIGKSRAPSPYKASKEWSRRAEDSTALYSCRAAHNRAEHLENVLFVPCL